MARMGNMKMAYGAKVTMEWEPSGTSRVTITPMMFSVKKDQWVVAGGSVTRESDELSPMGMDFNREDGQARMIVGGLAHDFPDWFNEVATMVSSADSVVRMEKGVIE